MFDSITTVIKNLNFETISEDRKELLGQLTDYIRDSSEAVKLHFICTHNSRRSQFCQVWAAVAAAYYKKAAICYSGGTEVTACNYRVIASLQRIGFKVDAEEEGENQVQKVYFGEANSLKLYSKLINAEGNPVENFAAVMTCRSADEACPIVDGANIRIPLSFIDPKVSDDTALESETYDQRSLQIATEIFYTFSLL